MAVLSSRDGYTRPENCNGCGSGWNARLVPNTIYFVSIKECCCIHNDRYEHGITPEDKEEADDEFLTNMNAVIAEQKKWYYPNFLARCRALKFYEVVNLFGDSAFYKK